jgi:hypothetical protein
MTRPRVRPRRLAFCAVTALLSLSSNAAAQPAGNAPARGSELSVLADVFGGYDMPTSSSREAAPGQLDSFVYGGGNASMGFTHAFRNLVFTSSGAASRYYSPDVPSLSPRYSASLGLASSGPSRWSWTLFQNVGYGQRDAANLFASRGLSVSNLQFGVPATGLDFGLSADRNLTADTAASLNFAMSRRDRLSFSGGLNTVFLTEGEDTQYVRFRGQALYTRSAGRYYALRAGYRYDQAQAFEGGDLVLGRQAIHGIDLGLSYSRPLPFSRRTTVSLDTGSSAVPRTGRRWDYFVVGNGGIRHEFGRSWQAEVAVERSVRFVVAFPDATLTNAASVSFGGRPATKLYMAISGNYSFGTSGFTTEPFDFEAYSGTATVRVTPTNAVGLFAEYFYFVANLDGAAAAPFGADLGRHGVRAGVSIGTNLLGRRRN